MEKIYTGNIKQIFKNYGIIEAEEKDVKVNFFFLITPDMLYKDKFLKISKKVNFMLTDTEIRGVHVKLAYNVKPIENEEIKKYTFSKVKIDTFDDYENYVYMKFYKIDDLKIIKSLINADIVLKSHLLNWILFIEKGIKNALSNLCNEYEINSENIYQTFIENPQTSNIHTKIMKKVKSKYLFRPEFELLKIRKDSNGNIKNCEIVDMPFALYLDNLTMDEMSKILSVLLKKYFTSLESQNSTLKFILYISEIFTDLSIMRNACAHGNPLIPHILDDSYASNYLYDLKSVFPSFNSNENDNVEKLEIFSFLRYTTKQLAKMGYTPFRIGTPSIIGLYLSKYILINPIRRSLFGFLFIIICYFNYIDNSKKEEFINQLGNFFPLKNKQQEDDEIYKLLNSYPKNESVICKITMFMYPLYFCFDNDTYFKLFLESSFKVGK